MSKFARVVDGVVDSISFESQAGENWRSAPDDVFAGHFFDGQHWTAPVVVPAIPDSVSARQFKLQLLAAGLIDQVETWVSGQDRATRIAYEYSGRFERNSPMMQSGFAALGSTPEQIEAFFVAAAAL